MSRAIYNRLYLKYNLIKREALRIYYREAFEGTSKFSQRSFSPVNWVKIWRTPYPCHPVPSVAATAVVVSPPPCATTTLLPNPCTPPFSLECTSQRGRWWRRWNADVRLAESSLTSRGWVSICACMQSPLGPPAISIADPSTRPTLHAEGRNRHREMVHASSKPQFSKAVRRERLPYASLTFFAVLQFFRLSEISPLSW